MKMPLFILLSIPLALFFGGCDSIVAPPDVEFEEGQELEVVTYSPEQPGSREAYAEMGTFVTPGHLVVFDPGTGPEAPPRVIRSFSIPDHITIDAQMDRDGFVWVATPDLSRSVGGGASRVVYVVDPHASTVHRVIRLPHELRAVGAVLVGPEQVYLRAWRDGFSGGIGAVDRRCALDQNRCEVQLFTELGNVGNTSEKAFHLTDNALYSFSLGNSRSGQESTDRIDPRTGEITESSPYSGTFVFDEEAFYVIGYQFDDVPGTKTITRLEKQTLTETGREAGDARWDNLIAIEGDRLYVTGFNDPAIEVRSTETLEPVDTLDVSATNGATAVFGFVAPGVLMLNHNAWLNTETGEVVADALPLEAQFSQALRLPEGHPLAY